MKKYEYDGIVYCVVYRDEDWIKGLNFITPDDYFIQAGSWWYDNGKGLDYHTNNEFERKAYRQQKSVYVKKGSINVILFSEAPLGPTIPVINLFRSLFKILHNFVI